MKAYFTVLVCGGRDYSNQKKVFEVLDKLLRASELSNKKLRIVHGAAKGADYIANKWAETRKAEVVSYPAKWNEHGKAAGPFRNQEMLTKESPDVIIAFKGGKGTKDMIQRAKKFGVPVYEVQED